VFCLTNPLPEGGKGKDNDAYGWNMKLYKVNRKIWEGLPMRITLCKDCQERYEGEKGITFIRDFPQGGKCNGCGAEEKPTPKFWTITLQLKDMDAKAFLSKRAIKEAITSCLDLPADLKYVSMTVEETNATNCPEKAKPITEQKSN
jgi:hypothetical protein